MLAQRDDTNREDPNMIARGVIAGFALLALVATTGCQDNGGVAGMGRQETVGTGVGAAAGGLIGNRIGDWLDKNHHQTAADTAARAAEVPTGQRVSWAHRDILGNVTASGWASPTANATRRADGRLCRPIHEEATQGGQTRTDNLTLCKNDQGAWVAA